MIEPELFGWLISEMVVGKVSPRSSVGMNKRRMSSGSGSSVSL